MYVNREAGTCFVNPRPLTSHDSTPTATTVREPGQGIGVTMVARPTASKGWRREPEHGRRRPTTGVTTLDQQRPVRQRYVKDVRPTTSPSHSTPLDSTATPVDGSTITLPSTNSGRHTRLSGNTHGRQFVSSSGSVTRPSYSVGLNTPTLTVRHGNSSATRAQFHSHCVSMIHINRLTDYYNGP